MIICRAEMQSNACISKDCKTVCRHYLCNHPAPCGVIAYRNTTAHATVIRSRSAYHSEERIMQA